VSSSESDTSETESESKFTSESPVAKEPPMNGKERERAERVALIQRLHSSPMTCLNIDQKFVDFPDQTMDQSGGKRIPSGVS